jgi:hypothetical protein
MRTLLLALTLALSCPAMAHDAGTLEPAALLSHYDAVRAHLVADHQPEAAEAARHLAGHVDDSSLGAALVAVADAKDLANMRLAFAEVSRLLVLRFSDEPPRGLRVYHCPMAPGYAYWLQPQAGLQNPYMGTAMPGCGEGTSLKAAVSAAQPGSSGK